MTTLQSQLNELARIFAEQIVGALRSASVGELVSTGGGRVVANGRTSNDPVAKAVPTTVPRAPKTARPAGRLRRRSAEQIQAGLTKIIALVRKHKDGLRAEEIRSNLGMQSKEMPRILKEGISAKKLTSRGQKRATTYFAK